MSITWILPHAEDEHWMRLALAQAQQAMIADEVPVGAVLVADNQLIAAAHNQPITSHDATAHAEIAVLRLAGQAQHNYRLPGATLYVTLEPCMMCLGALIHARIARLVFATREPRAGFIVSRAPQAPLDFVNHRLMVAEGVLAEASAQLLKSFFQQKRQS